MKKIEVIVRTTEDNFPPQEKVVLKFTEQTVSPAENDAVLSYPGLEIHLEHHRVFKNGQEVYMSRYEYGVLSLMARHPGQLFTKEQTFEAVWHQDSESYSLPSALSDGKENSLILQNSVNASKWVFWAQEGCHLFLLQKVSCEVSCLTPLYILQVPLTGPHTTSEAQEFFRMYHSYSEITNPSDRMRWCRYRLGLLQKDVAAMVGMEEWLYQDLESGNFRRSFSPEIADKLADFYSIPVKDLLDDYALFFHRGGGAFLREYRQAKGWDRQQLAEHAKVGRTSIRCWETGQKTISQKCFRLLAENLGSDFLSMLRM